MIELVLNKIKVDETRGENVIIFREKEGTRYLPVVIGLSEVQSIKMKLGGMTPPRPLTHDLILQILTQLSAKLESVVIDRLENSTFYAKLNLVKEGGVRIQVDARPSDSAALAVRSGVPVFVSEEVMGQASVVQI